MPSEPRLFSTRLRHLIEELKFADQQLIAATPVDGPLLRDVRQALDNLRLTAWAVCELQNARETNKDGRSMISFLTAERMRRFRQMVDDFAADLEHDGIAWPSASSYGLQESVSRLREQLGLLTYRRRGNGS